MEEREKELESKYGRLTIISPADKNKWGYVMVKCLCDCGNERIVSLYDLKRGHTTSCGCFHSDKLTAYNTTHGMSRTPTHNSWRGMVERCNNPKHEFYRYYGGRGVSVCERWLSFDNFYYDMGDKPKGCSIDRINTNGNYELNNCRWSTIKEQARNARSNRLIKYKDRVQCVAAWAEERGMNKNVLEMRLLRGWPVEEAIERPAKQGRINANS